MSNARHAAALEQRAITIEQLRTDVVRTLQHLVDLDAKLATIAEDRDVAGLGFWTDDTRAAAGKAAVLDRAAARGYHARRDDVGLAFLNGGPMLGSGRVVAPVAIQASSAAAEIRYGLLHHLRRLGPRAHSLALELEQTHAEDEGWCPWPRLAHLEQETLGPDASTVQLARRLARYALAYANRPGLQALSDDLDRLEETARDVVDGPSKSNHPDACPWCGRHSLVVRHREAGQDAQVIRCEGEHPCRCDYAFCGCHRNPRDNRHEWVNTGRAANTWHQLHNLITSRKEAAAMEYRATEALEQIRQLHRPIVVDEHAGELPARFPLTGDAVPEHHECNDGCQPDTDINGDNPTMVHEVDLCGTCGQVPLHTGQEPHTDELWPCPTYRAADLESGPQ